MAYTIVEIELAAYPAPMTQEIGQLIRELRENVGLSQNALARAAGIDPTNLNRIERGRQGPPRQTTVLRIIRGLGLKVSDERVQRLLLATSGGVEHSAVRSVDETGVEYDHLLAPTLRELRATIFRALELVSMLEDVIEDGRTTAGSE